MGLELRKRENEEETAPASSREDLAAELASAHARIATLEAGLSDEARRRAEWTALLSHEMRTPITVIAGFARLLLDPTTSALQERPLDFVAEIVKANRRLDRFVSDLLGASPTDATPFAVHPEMADLHVTLQSTVDSMGPLFREKGLSVEVELDESVRPFLFDADRIEQVISNLASNAMRYGKPSGRLRFATEFVGEESEGEVRITVEDDGPGISSWDRERVFQPYVRGEGQGQCEGLGIGLTVSAQIVGAHGGSIEIDDGPLGGACFVFVLPCNPSAASTPEGY